ncbi:MAG: Gfo/Idh/MocA family oxidoreductase [Firmicutes bacterium]|nr:Gfo/Idh/MocA family oxidoreductase [Bacillota bacterium]
MDSSKIGIGVIGLFMGKNLLYINRHETAGSEVRAVCDVDPERLKANQEEFRVPFATTDYRELIARSDIDVVGIFTPDHLHIQMIREALEAGKHIICTKPMVNSLAEARETCELVKRSGRKFLVGQTRRYVRHHMEAKALFDSGKIGLPLMAEASYVHGDIWKVFDRGAWRYEVPQNMLYGAMCHPVDHLRWYFGDVDEVFAYGCPGPIDPRYPQDQFPNAMANLKFKNGVIARLLQATGVVEPPYGSESDVMPMEGVSIFGTRGTIANYHARYFEDNFRGTYRVVDFSKSEATADFDGKEYSGHAASVLRYIREMEQCIWNDTRPQVDEVEGAKCIAVCSAIEESIAAGKPVKVFNDF